GGGLTAEASLTLPNWSCKSLICHHGLGRFLDVLQDLQLQESACVATASAKRQRYSHREKEKSNSSVKNRMLEHLVAHPGFEIFFAVVVLTNAIFIGVDVEKGLEDPGPRSLELQILQVVYTVLFVAELMLRVFAKGT
ncbi:unnamed protein product, partial [Effrenium voratum]